MKFDITIWKTNATGKHEERQRVRGFTRLEDACAAVWGIHTARGETDGHTCAVWLPKSGGHDAAVIGMPHHRTSLGDTLTNCQAGLKRALSERRLQKARWKYAQSRGTRFHEALMANETARQAFCRNDFATVNQLIPVTDEIRH